MEANKVIGSDGIHVEMLKANPGEAAELLTKMWQLVGETGIVPRGWLTGTIVPFHIGKGEQQEPANSRPLCILSHVRKLVEKAVVTELVRTFVTSNAQYVFQNGIQVTQAALSVLAAIYKGADFIVVLDLAKAYYNMLMLMMQRKLDRAVDENLTSQLIIFLLTFQATVSGEITETAINMLRGLTQGRTSSSAFFRVFINELPKEVREGLRAAGMQTGEMDPIRLVADDVIGLIYTIEKLQTLLKIFEEWAAKNYLQWNPIKSQVLQLKPNTTVTEDTVLLDGCTCTS